MNIDQQASFIYFVYPFLFDTDQFASYLNGFELAHWEGRKRPLKVWDQQDFPEEELLSHVADFLNPPEDKAPAARLLKLRDDALRSPRGLGGGENSSVDWRLVTAHGEIPFCVLSIQLALFRIGVGFLTVCAEPTNRSDQADDWLDFLHYFRFARDQRGVSLVASRKVGFDRETRQPRTEPFFPDPAGGLEHHPDGSGNVTDLLYALLSTAVPQQTDGSWWRDVFIPGQLLPFAVIYADGIADEEILYLTYRIRNFFRSQQEMHPARDDLRLDHELLLPYAEGQWFFFSLDGGGYIACNSPETEFFRRTLPDHLRTHYFLLFLLALQQRFALMMLVEQVAAQWSVGDSHAVSEESQRLREEAFARIRDQLLFFTAHGHFAQVMQREHHHRCYRKWQDIFQVAQLYQEVSDEVRYMHSYLQTEQERRTQRLEESRRKQTESLERRLNLIAWVIGVPALALAVLDAIGPVSLSVVLYTLLGSLVTGLLVYLVVIFLVGRGSTPRR
jgi:hypothetical protein